MTSYNNRRLLVIIQGVINVNILYIISYNIPLMWPDVIFENESFQDDSYLDVASDCHLLSQSLQTVPHLGGK